MMGSILPILCANSIAPVFRNVYFCGLFRHIFHINKHYHALKSTHTHTLRQIDGQIDIPHTYTDRYTCSYFISEFSSSFFILSKHPNQKQQQQQQKRHTNKNIEKKLNIHSILHTRRENNILHLDRNFAMLNICNSKFLMRWDLK